MNCKKCMRDYALHGYEYYDSGMRCFAYKWILKSVLKFADHIQLEGEKAAEQARMLAKKKYWDVWLARFEGESKKGAWVILTENGKEYPSLSTFYSHTRNEDLSHYLKSFFQAHLNRVLLILNVRDKEIYELLNKSKASQERAAALLREQ